MPPPTQGAEMQALVQAIDALEAKATKGPWASAAREGDDWDSVVHVPGTPYEICQCFHDEDKDECETNVALIAALRNAWPTISAELKRAHPAAAEAVNTGLPEEPEYFAEACKLLSVSEPGKQLVAYIDALRARAVGLAAELDALATGLCSAHQHPHKALDCKRCYPRVHVNPEWMDRALAAEAALAEADDTVALPSREAIRSMILADPDIDSDAGIPAAPAALTPEQGEAVRLALLKAQRVLRRWTNLYAHLQNGTTAHVARAMDYNLPPAEHVSALEDIAELLSLLGEAGRQNAAGQALGADTMDRSALGEMGNDPGTLTHGRPDEGTRGQPASAAPNEEIADLCGIEVTRLEARRRIHGDYAISAMFGDSLIFLLRESERRLRGEPAAKGEGDDNE